MDSRPPPSTANTDSRDLSTIDAAQLFQACFDSSDSLMTISTLADGRLIDVNKAWQEAF